MSRGLWDSLEVMLKLNLSWCLDVLVNIWNSPLYKGSTLWDNLSDEIQQTRSADKFTKRLGRINRNYIDLLWFDVLVLLDYL